MPLKVGNGCLCKPYTTTGLAREISKPIAEKFAEKRLGQGNKYRIDSSSYNTIKKRY